MHILGISAFYHDSAACLLRDGEIIEQGDHDDLLRQAGYYAELYNTYFRHQSLEYIESAGEALEELSH